ncbi:MAG: sigma-54-dependent Fis family transcriptional regulator [Candidatus Puniceispirillum sp.]|nr:sigma-54-dependent Fis family transcriptional regulator [Candidatus Puniceispirillum sp.]MBL6774653.1 sigma-54-dependent Fis family transcriptional regulator [Candidatus Puniceispirillum sp.]
MADDILIVDDEKDIRSLLCLMLEDEGYNTIEAANADDARTALLAQPPKLAILDIWMRESDMDGIELLEWVKSIYPGLPVLMISGHGTIETAVQAIRLGAYDFIEKPFKEARLLMTVERALDNARLARENTELRARVNAGEKPELVGNSVLMRGIRQSIEKVAPTASRVLINGPSGSGKELAARVIHNQSDRANELFVVANCARLSSDRVDAELFGAESLQSHRRVVGLFEQAHRGTLYFDEICDLPLETQRKIVRAVNEQRFRRVGGNSEVAVDVRMISASSRDLPVEISEGRLREDLYYRLGVVPLSMPSLADRREDIPLLAKYFTNRIAKMIGVKPIQLSEEIFAAMQGYDWPGNVRQMHNVIETLLIMAPDDRSKSVGLDLLPAEIQNMSRHSARSDMEQLLALPLRGAREEFEREYLETQLHRFNGNISRMAAFIGMERSALHRKMKSLGIGTDLQEEGNKT